MSPRSKQEAIEPPIPPNAPARDELVEEALTEGSPMREIELAEVFVDDAGGVPLAVQGLRVEDSELRSVTVAPGRLRDFVLRDSRLLRCDFSNLAARRGEMRRLIVEESKWIGFALTDGDFLDIRFKGGSMLLSSFANGSLRRVVFRETNLREAVFVGTTLDHVVFEDCDLAGADFRGAQIRNCAIRGCSLDGIAGIESLRGVRMPWAELLDSAPAMAAALGIEAELEDDV